MKIFMADTENGRFSHYMRDHWRELGHEVVLKGGYDPEKADWADLIYIEWTDVNAQLASKQEWFNKDHKGRYSRPIKDRENKKIVNRMIDVDMWASHGRAVDWSGIDELIFIAPHIQRVANERFKKAGIDKVRQHLIRPGVDLDKWTFREKRNEPVKNIGFVGELWENKGIDRALRILIELVKRDSRNWNIHFRGRWPNHSYFYHYCQNLIDKNNISDLTHFYLDRVPDLNEWYEQIDYLLLPSIKEAFSYVTAESSCKGIKPILHRFFGASDIWPEEYLFDTETEAVEMLLDGDYNPRQYRHYIEVNYDVERMLKEVDQVCGIS